MKHIKSFNEFSHTRVNEMFDGLTEVFNEDGAKIDRYIERAESLREPIARCINAVVVQMEDGYLDIANEFDDSNIYGMVIVEDSVSPFTLEGIRKRDANDFAVVCNGGKEVSINDIEILKLLQIYEGVKEIQKRISE